MKQKPFDFPLFALVLVLLGLGMLMVFSASAYYAKFYFDNKYEFLQKQALFGALGVFAMLVISRIDYHKIAIFSPALIFLSIVLLALVRVPGIGRNINGSWRWFNLGFTTFQPSEFMKIALVLFLAFSLSRRNNPLDKLITGLGPYLLVVVVIDFELYIEPHMSALMLVTGVAVIILFCAGVKWLHVLIVGSLGGTVIYLLAFAKGYRQDRLDAFLDPFADPTGDGFQTVNSLYAIGSGSWFGRGLGQSMQKNLFIPEPQNDFIFSIVAEELGLVGAATIILLFLLLIWRGIRIATNAPDMLGSLICVGISSFIGLQMLVNIAVVTNTVPNTGVPLPFFSAGGTSLAFLLAGMGLMLNVSRQILPRWRFAQNENTEKDRTRKRLPQGSRKALPAGGAATASRVRREAAPPKRRK